MPHDEMVPISIWPWKCSLYALFWHTSGDTQDVAGLRKRSPEISFLIEMAAGEFPMTTKTTSAQEGGCAVGRRHPRFSFFLFEQNGNMSQTGLTFRLQLTVIAPVMDQMNRGCHNGREWWGGGRQRCNNHTLRFHLCQISTHTLFPNDSQWQTLPPGTAGGGWKLSQTATTAPHRQGSAL